MEAKPLTKEGLALTEKKMDMALDDIIKMSKTKAAKGKRARFPNKSQRSFKNAAQDKSMKLQRFMNSRPLLRQGVLSQKRSNFRQNQFPLANEVARKAAVAPFHSKASRDRIMYSIKARARAPLVMSNRSSNNTTAISKHQQQELGNGDSRLQRQTLDARFANLKEQRMKAAALSLRGNSMSHHSGGGSRKQIPPWTRFPK